MVGHSGRKRLCLGMRSENRSPRSSRPGEQPLGRPELNANLVGLQNPAPATKTVSRQKDYPDKCRSGYRPAAHSSTLGDLSRPILARCPQLPPSSAGKTPSSLGSASSSTARAGGLRRKVPSVASNPRPLCAPLPACRSPYCLGGQRGHEVSTPGDPLRQRLVTPASSRRDVEVPRQGPARKVHRPCVRLSARCPVSVGPNTNHEVLIDHAAAHAAIEEDGEATKHFLFGHASPS